MLNLHHRNTRFTRHIARNLNIHAMRKKLLVWEDRLTN